MSPSRSTTHLVQLLHQPGTWSAQLSNLCSVKCCGLEIKSATEWLSINVLSPKPQPLEVLT